MKTVRLKKQSPLLSLQNWKNLVQGHLPGQVVIQYTDVCNAQCVQCGMRVGHSFKRTTLNPNEVKRLLQAIARQGIKAVSFTGGEPLIYLKEIAECMHYANELGIPYIRTGTNGFIFKNHQKPDFELKIADIAKTLAAAHIYTFWISIDSAIPEVHEKNRGLSRVIAGIEKGLPIFHEHGIYPSANLGINRYIGGYENAPHFNNNHFDPISFYDHFHQAFRDFYQLVKSLGFTIVNACYPMSLDEEQAKGLAVYTATSVDDMVRFHPHEKIALFKALFDTIPEFRSQLRIFTPRSSLMALIRQHEGQTPNYFCRGGIDFFFIDSKDMNTYPCGYRGAENLGKFWDIDRRSLMTQAWCKQCDWECFRDPSEFLGPFREIMQHPIQLLKRFTKDKEYAKVWYEDIQYYRACDYFNARLPPHWDKLSQFA